MHEAGLGADMFGDIGQEGDDVVFDLALDLVDACDLERAALPDRAGGLLGHQPLGDHGVGGVGFNFEPDPEPGLGFPDVDHLRPGIAGYHGMSSQLALVRPPCSR